MLSYLKSPRIPELKDSLNASSYRPETSQLSQSSIRTGAYWRASIGAGADMARSAMTGNAKASG